jgi:hemoglobin
MTAPLFERLGGDSAILAAVHVFYRRVMDDDLTRPFFATLDMTEQTRKQTAFMAWAFGGPSKYKGQDLRTAHARLVAEGLSDVHFDAILGHLEATLVELDVERSVIAEVLAIVGRTRDEVLNR